MTVIHVRLSAQDKHTQALQKGNYGKVPAEELPSVRESLGSDAMYYANFYDENYYDGSGKSNYLTYTFESSPFAQHVAAISRYMRTFGLTGPVLDVGCAKGYLVYVLRQRGIEAFGVDWSEYALSCANADIQPYLVLASAMQLPFRGQTFSLAVTHDVLEHLDEPAAEAALCECARVSRRQLHQVNTGRLPEWLYEQDESHVLKLTLPQWRIMAGNLGLHRTTIREPNRGLPVPSPVPG